jgi:hypothetical protein
MDVEKIPSYGSSKKTQNKSRSSTPDSEEFRELMKTQKVPEAEFEKPKKRPKQQKTGLGAEEAPAGAPPSANPPFASPYDAYSKQYPTTESYSIERPPQPPEDQNQDETKRKEEQKDLSEYQKSQLAQAPEDLKMAKEEKKEIKSVKAEKTKTEQSSKSEKITKKTEKEALKESKEQKEPPSQGLQSTVLQEMPQNVATQTSELTQAVTPYLSAEVAPLFQKMVGTIIQMQAQGVSTTELILNSPAFQTSVFYGSSVVIEKYSSAPAFNVFLKGPVQAVNLFTENLDGLSDAFAKAKIQIGRLEAHHSTFMFRRKEKTSMDKDTKKEK